MTFLEAILLRLTRETTPGEACQLGDASITVRCSSGQCSWEYGGRTFWEVHDLAEAIIEGSNAVPAKLPPLSKRARAMRDTYNQESFPGGSFTESEERSSGWAL